MICCNVWVGKRDFVMVSNEASQNLDVVLLGVMDSITTHASTTVSALTSMGIDVWMRAGLS